MPNRISSILTLEALLCDITRPACDPSFCATSSIDAYRSVFASWTNAVTPARSIAFSLVPPSSNATNDGEHAIAGEMVAHMAARANAELIHPFSLPPAI
jgi:hypothetical protein